MTYTHYAPGDRVLVRFKSGLRALPATVTVVFDKGPFRDDETVKVTFDDPMVYGGLGVAWVSPEILSEA